MFGELPYESTQDVSRAVFAISSAVFLLATGNVIVRLVLTMASVNLSRSSSPDKTIRGGRVIGPIERLLIFGLALVGEPTAAVLVISAKGLLRFQELRADDGDQEREIDQLTEYLVVGSLVSWALALAPLVFFPVLQ